MNQPNPFSQQMVKLHIPEGMGTSVSIEGFNLEGDEDRCVEVPKHLTQRLKDHGLVDAPAKAEGKQKK